MILLNFDTVPINYWIMGVGWFFIGVWLLLGLLLDHVISEEPLAGRGFDPHIDNILKLYCMVVWSVVCAYPVTIEFTILMIIVAISLLVIREATGWIS